MHCFSYFIVHKTLQQLREPSTAVKNISLRHVYIEETMRKLRSWMHKHILCERHQHVYKDQQLKYSADRQQEHVCCETVFIRVE